MKLYLGCSQALQRKIHRFALGNDLDFGERSQENSPYMINVDSLIEL